MSPRDVAEILGTEKALAWHAQRHAATMQWQQEVAARQGTAAAAGAGAGPAGGGASSLFGDDEAVTWFTDDLE